MGKNNKVKIDGAMELAQVVTYLEDIVKGLKSGAVHVQLGQDSVLLHPASILSFEMEVSQKKDKEKFSFEMSWKKEDRSTEDVKISANAPTVEIS